MVVLLPLLLVLLLLVVVPLLVVLLLIVNEILICFSFGQIFFHSSDRGCLCPFAPLESHLNWGQMLYFHFSLLLKSKIQERKKQDLNQNPQVHFTSDSTLLYPAGSGVALVSVMIIMMNMMVTMIIMIMRINVIIFYIGKSF